MVDFQFLQPGYSPPPAAAVDFDGALQLGNGWAGQTFFAFGVARPELRLIPWVAEAACGLVATAELSDSFLLGVTSARLSLYASASLAPSWYIRQPFVGGRSGIRLGWSPQQRIEPAIRAPHAQAPPKQPQVVAAWGELEQVEPAVRSGWSDIPRLERETAFPHGDLSATPQAAIGCDYSRPDPKQVEHLSIPWGDLDDIAADIGAGWFPAPERKYRDDHIPWSDLTAINRQLDLPYSAPPAKDVEKPIISGPYWYPRWCVWQYNPPKGNALIFNFPLVAYAPPAGDQLIFADVQEAGREHICYDGTWNGPTDGYWYQPHEWDLVSPNIRRVYIVMNTVTLERLSDGVPIPVEDLTIGTDMDSWAWTLRAALVRKSDLDLVRPQAGAPVEVEADINGLTWRFVIEEYGEESRWGQRAYTITGRSLSAYLADPYSAPRDRVEAAQATAQQLAEAELIDTGFSVAWSLPTWLVPGNVWSYQGQAPIQAIAQIAQAAGGVVHTATASLTLQIKPWYSALPWEWGGVAVDAILPGAMIDSRRGGYIPKTIYTGVYVRGQQTGVMCLVKRIGSDGSALAPMQTHPLVTATEAGLALGQKILADSGPRETVTLTLPLLDNPGLLVPGHLIEVQATGDTWRGQVIKCGITARRPAVQQTIDVIRYHGS